MKISRILLIVIISFTALSAHAIEKKFRAVIITPDHIYQENNLDSWKMRESYIGEKFFVISVQDNWVEVKNGRKNSFWLRRENVVLTNNVEYTGKAIVNHNDIRLMTKDSGDDNKLLRKLKLGEIVTILPSEEGTKLRTEDGNIGYIRRQKHITRLGPMSEEEISNLNFYQKIMQKEGKAYDSLYNIKAWGEKSKTKKSLIFILSVILFFLPMFLLSKYVNLACSVRFIPTWLIKLSLIFISFNAIAYVFPFYFMTPLYKNILVGLAFGALSVYWVFREWKKIDYHRCPSCHSMFATADKGKIFLGGWKSTRTTKYDDGTTETSTTTTKNFRDDRECLICGHRWSIRRTKTVTR